MDMLWVLYIQNACALFAIFEKEGMSAHIQALIGCFGSLCIRYQPSIFERPALCPDKQGQWV